MKKQSAQLLSKAIQTASTHHEFQYDKGGAPYILHCLRVMHGVLNRFPNDYELAAIAVMHDVVEDTNMTVDLIRRDFNSTIASAVDCLSKRSNDDDDEYLDRVLSNHFSSIVKLFDLKDNMDPMRLKGLRQKDFDRMVKYQRMFYTIKQSLNERGTVI